MKMTYEVIRSAMRMQEELAKATRAGFSTDALQGLIKTCENLAGIARADVEKRPVWYIDEVKHTGGAFDMIDFTVYLRNRLTGETKNIHESVSHFEMCSDVLLENYGGDHRQQQSVLITLTDSDTGDEWQKQVEINHVTGDWE